MASKATIGTASSQRGATRGRPGKIKWLDGLRGLAALLVVARHAGYLAAHDVGAPAVDAFFVLSAFLLTLGLEATVRPLLQRQTPATDRTWAWVLAEYAMRRLLRVYPLFALVACFLAALPAPWRATLFRIEDPAQFDLVQVLVFSFDFRYHVFWSLPVEIGYYCLLPVVVVVTVKLGRHWWWALGVPLYALVFASGFFFHRTRHQPMWPHVPTFLCGSLAAIVYSKLQFLIARRHVSFAPWHRLMIRSVELFFLALILSVVFDGLFFHWVGENPLPQQSGGTRFTSFHVTAVLVAELVLPGGPIAALLESPPLLYAGKVSYSMYLLHSFAVYAPCVQRMAYYDRFFATWGLVFALSALAHAAVEVPCQRLAAKLGEYMKHQRNRSDYAALPRGDIA